ncbi:hypothetical protein PY254_10490 [Rhodanobacter sp. AS-Z3]|uniref:hypothetical protein n=1 Tax=Rhodanobacter sp. AS-Z3 TaxID=3031330 RepID=UPI002479BE54|nr:hypothetical protein [Rhodanobacter sp. AS-Z3]WEN13674.1 hypothetical protein PY254_10490 [Rhodanobacter sp. AS-Z3]
MTPLRPIGHIAGNLPILAVTIVYRVRMANDARQYVCWVDDDGCVYLALTSHPRANAMLRHAQEQRVNTYRKPRQAPFPCTATDITDDLRQARAAFAQRTLHEASEAAA